MFNLEQKFHCFKTSFIYKSISDLHILDFDAIVPVLRMMGNQMRVELLQAEGDESDQSFLRLLVDGRTIKHITIERGMYSPDDMCFGLSASPSPFSHWRLE